MKTTISILLILITFNVFSQDLEIGEIKEVKEINFDDEYNNITIDGITYKCLQFSHYDPKRFRDINLGYMKKTIRIKPLGSDFFNENYNLQYWQTKEGKVRVFLEAWILDVKYKEDKDSTKLNQLQQN